MTSHSLVAEMPCGGTSSSLVSSVGEVAFLDSPSIDSSKSVKLWMDGDDPYTGIEGFSVMDDTIIEEEEVPQEQEETDQQERVVVAGDNLHPYIGMSFETADEAFNFYNSYALHVGFSIRKNSHTTSKVGVSFVKFVCNKEGFSRSQRAEQKMMGSNINQKTPERDRENTRTNCKACLRVRLVDGAVWKVSVFNEEHNHELIRSPSKRRNLRSQRKLNLAVKEIINDMNAQNVGTSQILRYIAKKHGGHENINIKKKDVSNHISMENRKLIGRDVKTTLEYFKKKQSEDPEFFYEIDADENGIVQHVFWVDGRARRTWLEFGDVITFDTTYNTNKYCMPLAPFIGPNHHRYSLFYGMALIRSEQVKNFEWLFVTWLKAMYGKHPTSIITDQDPAMRIAIKKIFPNTTHRCCQWHVMRKAREHLLKQYSSIEGFEKELKTVINRSLTVSDFERSWKQMLKDYKVEDVSHLAVMFKSASEWVPAYFRCTFFADMTTSQRSESMNAILKLWVGSHTSLYRFVQKMDSLVEGIWHKVSDEDIKCLNQVPNLWSYYEIEKKAREVYTRSNFRIFKEILKESTLGNVIEIKCDILYEVSIKKNSVFRNWVPESYCIEVDKANERFNCSCKGFEFEGFLCQHAIKVMLHLDVENLPNHYILKRWCKNANAVAKRPVGERSMELGVTDALKAFRKTSLQPVYRNLEELASTSAEAFAYVRSGMLKLQEGVMPMVVNKEIILSSVAKKPDALGDRDDNGSNNEPAYLDTVVSSCKGRKKRPARWKPPTKTNAKQRRTCSYCHTKESHNIRTCPKRLKDIAEGKKRDEHVSNEDMSSQDINSEDLNSASYASDA